MLIDSNILIPESLIVDAIQCMPADDKWRISINQPTGNFFYDPWITKQEYKNSPWDELIATIGQPVGEARIIAMKPGTCYMSHADIDDRWYLNLTGQKSYLIDLDNEQMYNLQRDAKWYEIDTSHRHTATNFGPDDRIQLVVRKLLQRNTLIDSVKVEILPKIEDPNEDSRFYFDDVISPWLNRGCKQGIISNFKTDRSSISFEIEKTFLHKLCSMVEKINLVIDYAGD